MRKYRAAVVGCSRMGGFIDNEAAGSATSVPPYSHGAGYYVCRRTDLVACSDLREEVMQEFGKRYDVPAERQYLDYRRLIADERLEIVSVATQPEQRCEIAIYAAEHGARAIYAEKAMAASLREADAMVEAVERNGVAFNLGTNRRWDPGYDRMKGLIDGGRLGGLESIIIYANGSLFNTASHAFDLMLRMNDDRPVAWVQASLKGADGAIDGDVIGRDPVGQGIVQFHNGVTAYALVTRRNAEFEVICAQGVATALRNGAEWQLRLSGAPDHRGRSTLAPGRFPEFQRASSILRLIEDLVHSLDTGEPTRGGVRVARAGMELIFAFIESHRRGGAVVELPLEHCTLRLQRDRAPRQPRYTP